MLSVFDTMATKLALFAIFAALTHAVPLGKDLAADISDAKLKVGIFDLQVVNMLNQLNVLDVSLNLPIEDLAQNIFANLALIANQAAIAPVRQAFRAFRDEYNTNSRDQRQILAQQLRTTLSRINDQLDVDLNQVPSTTNLLRAEIANHDLAYNALWDSVYLRTGEAKTAIDNAVNGQDGPEVVLIYSDLQKIYDILSAEDSETFNVKIVFDARGSDTLVALDLVIGQIP
ncbi:uncharacterized protein LOC132199584 [Neocloeon triangulifer]|uniref:uncharacterized protein LOC132199584 n=1 Tax=Neocloeon triangulifer TaxID=2078957 RepID=UPI00286F5F83|nr:uncharacterized protein LOC132199584 [Neocloeon triangulifer]